MGRFLAEGRRTSDGGGQRESSFAPLHPVMEQRDGWRRRLQSQWPPFPFPPIGHSDGHLYLHLGKNKQAVQRGERSTRRQATMWKGRDDNAEIGCANKGHIHAEGSNSLQGRKCPRVCTLLERTILFGCNGSANQRFSRPCEPASALKKRTGELLQKDSLWDLVVRISSVYHTLDSHKR